MKATVLLLVALFASLAVSFTCESYTGNGNTYEWVSDPDSWMNHYQAAADEDAPNSHLGTITDAEENDCVADNTPNTNDVYWSIGGIQSFTATDREEGWTWITGENFEQFANWGPLEANEAGNADEAGRENFLQFGFQTEAFADGPLNGNPGYLVEIESRSEFSVAFETTPGNSICIDSDGEGETAVSGSGLEPNTEYSIFLQCELNSKRQMPNRISKESISGLKRPSRPSRSSSSSSSSSSSTSTSDIVVVPECAECVGVPVATFTTGPNGIVDEITTTYREPISFTRVTIVPTEDIDTCGATAFTGIIGASSACVAARAFDSSSSSSSTSSISSSISSSSSSSSDDDDDFYLEDPSTSDSSSRSSSKSSSKSSSRSSRSSRSDSSSKSRGKFAFRLAENNIAKNESSQGHSNTILFGSIMIAALMGAAMFGLAMARRNRKSDYELLH